MSERASGGGAWPQVRRDLLLGLVVWSLADLFFYTRMYLQLRADDDPAFTWAQIRGPHLVEAAADALTWTAFTPLVLYLARRWPLGRRLVPWLVHAAVSVPLAALNSGVNYGVAVALWPVRPRFGEWMSFGVHQNVQVYWMAAAAAMALEYHRQGRARELGASQLQAQLARARLHALQMQLHPHFLFNTLNSIAELVHHDPRGADRMIGQLGDLLRMTVDGSPAQEVTLRRELELVGAYLEIERTRFGGRLSVRTRVAPEALDALVPTLLLQPLVENAVRHGLSPRAAPGTLVLSAGVEGGTLRLAVADDGRGLRRDPHTGRIPERVGLGNTRARLAELYGAAHRFELGDAPGGGAVALVEIPFRTAPAREGAPPAGAAVEAP